MFRTIKNTFSMLNNKIYFKKKYNATVRSPYVARSVKFGHDCQVSRNVFIGHDVEIGDCTYFNSGVFGNIVVESGTRIGRYCSIAPNVFIGPGNHPINLLTTHPILFDDFWKKKFNIENKHLPKVERPGENAKIIIGNDVWIGTGVIITNGVRISDGAVIAAGSIVTKDVPPYSIVAGVPAKVIGERFSKEKIKKLDTIKIKWWDWPSDRMSKNIELLFDVDKYIQNYEGEKSLVCKNSGDIL